MECKCLSLDIWDTVLRRRCHPDEIKLATARFLYLSYFDRLRIDCRDVKKLFTARVAAERAIAAKHAPELDDEYCIKDVFSKMLSDVFSEPVNTESVVEELYYFELEQEKKMSYLDPDIVKVISENRYEKIGYISDFYADHEFLDELLENAGFPFKMDFKYVSCEAGLNKRSGRLFTKVLEELNIPADQLLHIGDNEYSDNSTPQAMGIHTIRFLPKEETEKRRNKENCFSFEAGHKLDIIEKELNLGESTAANLSPLFTNFIVWILEDCAKRNIKKIFYFTREGEFYIDIHKVVQQSGMFPSGSIPEAKIFEISRVSSFAPSIRNVSLEEMMRLWNQYSIQSMKAFAKSLSLNEEEFCRWLTKYGIPLDEVITYPWLDERVKSLFDDDGFRDYFQSEIEVKKALILQYASQKGLNAEAPETIAIVDIGWRGTIQDNLCYLFPNHRIVGYYLALENFLNEQPQNSEKYGFLNSQNNYQLLLRFVSPIEMICNSPNGSTVGYSLENGVVSAIRKKETAEDKIYQNFTKQLQEQIFEMSKRICEVYDKHALMADEETSHAYSQFFGVIASPVHHRKLVNAFFSLFHNEEFGVGSFVDKRTHLQLWLMIKAVFSKKARRQLKEFLLSTSWPQGYLTKYHLTPLIGTLNQKLGMH